MQAIKQNWGGVTYREAGGWKGETTKGVNTKNRKTGKPGTGVELGKGEKRKDQDGLE